MLYVHIAASTSNVLAFPTLLNLELERLRTKPNLLETSTISVMSLKVPTNAAIEGWLKTLGVKSIVEWDTVVILYRYHASLMTAEHIARMLGCATNEVINGR